MGKTTTTKKRCKNGQFRNNSSKKELWRLEKLKLVFFRTEERRNDEQKQIDTQTNYTKEKSNRNYEKKS